MSYEDETLDPMSPEEVLRLAETVENRGGLLDPVQAMIDASEVPDPAEALRAEASRLRGGDLRVYCEHCGHIDGHAPDCPGQQLTPPKAVPRAQTPQGSPEPIAPLVRRIGRSMLLRVLSALDGDDPGSPTS